MMFLFLSKLSLVQGCSQFRTKPCFLGKPVSGSSSTPSKLMNHYFSTFPFEQIKKFFTFANVLMWSESTDTFTSVQNVNIFTLWHSAPVRATWLLKGHDGPSPGERLTPGSREVFHYWILLFPREMTIVLPSSPLPTHNTASLIEWFCEGSARLGIVFIPLSLWISGIPLPPFPHICLVEKAHPRVLSKNAKHP